MKFDSGGIRERDTDRPIEALTEQDVFRVLQLPYIECVHYQFTLTSPSLLEADQPV